jgi:hypothetical protein
VFAGGAGQDKDTAKAGLETADDVGVHPVADHHGRLGVRLDPVQRAAHHQRVGLADEVRRDARRRVMSAATEPVAGSGPSLRRAGRVGVGRDEPRAAAINRIALVIASKE